MPLRKSHLYSSLWQSCDQLRGGMDASQYKDYVLTLLFMKYVSDKYAGSDDFADIKVPPGGSFADMVALKGTKEIGDGINKVIGRLAVTGSPGQKPEARTVAFPADPRYNGARTHAPLATEERS